jgi:ribosomal protein S18 acetylase RimI-like enzyme
MTAISGTGVLKITSNYGSVYLIINDTVAEISDMFIGKTARRMGHGSALVMECLNIARHLRCSKIILHVDLDNIPARKLYEQYGFKKTATEDHMEVIVNGKDQEEAPSSSV